MTDIPTAQPAGTAPMGEAARSWRRFTDALAEAGAAIHAREDRIRDPAQQAEITETIVYALIAGLLAYTNADRDRPEFTPILNSGIRRAATNADTVYLQAMVNGAGRYRITGRRGTVQMLPIQIFAGNLGFTDISVQDQVIVPPVSPGGREEFEILLSAERPEGYDGHWLRLDPTIPDQFVSVRYVAKDWSTEIDPQVAIEPLHCGVRKERTDPLAVLDRLQMVPGYVRGITDEWLAGMDEQLAVCGVSNEVIDVTAMIPTIAGQSYTHGVIEIGPDEAWIAEVDAPEGLDYWAVQLMDFAYNTLEFPFRQCSVNSDLGTFNSDGKLRIVVSDKDPGVVNWLDKNGYSKVQIRCRWFGTEHPSIRTSVVPFSELRNHLPPDMTPITPEERDAWLRKRSIGAQMRRRW